MSIDVKDTFNLYFHNKNVFSSTIHGRKLGKKVTKDFITSLDFDFSLFITLNSYQNVCNDDPEYDFDHCNQNQLMEDSMKLHNCTHPFEFNTSKICQDKNTMKLAEIMYSKMVNSGEDMTNKCPDPCTFFKLNLIQKGILGWKPGFHIIFPKRIQVAESYFLYNGLTILAEIGGYVGLFLGFSIYNAMDIIELMLKRYSWSK